MRSIWRCGACTLARGRTLCTGATKLERGSLVLEVPDQLGIVANVARLFSDRGANIIGLDQYLAPVDEAELEQPHPEYLDWWREDHPQWFKRNFLMRFEFSFSSRSWPRDGILEDVRELAKNMDGMHSLRFESTPHRVAVMASRSDHCIKELLFRWESGELPCEITAVLGNHASMRTTAESYGLPFYELKVTAEDKREDEILERTRDTDLLVLARYMQILSPQFLHAYRRPIVNIHHGLLPAFKVGWEDPLSPLPLERVAHGGRVSTVAKGARPYHQMYRAGVKAIGATAHYVTPQLDAGPIIQQDIAPVNHKLTAAELKQVGIGLERSALVTAVKKHLENKLVRFGDRVVVF